MFNHLKHKIMKTFEQIERAILLSEKAEIKRVKLVRARKILMNLPTRYNTAIETINKSIAKQRAIIALL